MRATPRSVLIVDDDPDTVEMYALGLSYEGYRPMTATDAESAARLVKIDRPNAVVTDLHLSSDAEGWRFIQSLRADPSTRDMIVIVLTGHNNASIHAIAQEFACAAVVLKPCLPEDLAKILGRLLPKRHRPRRVPSAHRGWSSQNH